MAGMAVAQVAFSVLDLDGTYAWYIETFGFLPSGGSTDLVGPEAAACQGLPESQSAIKWAVDTQDFFQLEFFRFDRPVPRRRRADWRPNDIGYALVGIHVHDFDGVLGLLSGEDRLVGPVVGPAGTRRVCVRDPEGNLLEIMEDDPRRPGAAERKRWDVPATTRFVRIVVEDLARARRFFVDTLGMEPAPPHVLHTAPHEAMWNLAGAAPDTLTMWSGDFLVEVAAYTSPAGRPRPDDYLLSDQGILNIAIASRTFSDYSDTITRVTAAGYHANPEMVVGPAAVRYLLDDQDVSVECLTIPDPDVERFAGFFPLLDATPA